MSFQGIRKIREAKRESPIIFGSEQLESYTQNVMPLPLNLKLKSGDQKEKKSTRDSEIKNDSLLRQTRRSSFGVTNSR
jgi:hypothetical protein